MVMTMCKRDSTHITGHAGLQQRHNDEGCEGSIILAVHLPQPAHHVGAEDFPHLPETPVLHPGGLEEGHTGGQVGLVDVNEALGLGERLNDEGSEPCAA